MDTPARLLRLLAMFTTRASWSADELAGRLEITTRTLRRDVTRLRELGYPITSTTGRYGGYELGAGGRLPPLLLDDDEAIAVSVALRDLSAEADPTLGEAALSASTKLRQVLPAALRDRVDALGEVVVGVRRTRTPRPGGRQRARRAAEPDDVRDGVPARRPGALHVPRRRRPRRASAASSPTGWCHSAGAGTSSGSISIATTGARIASTASSALVRSGHRNTPRPTPDAGALVAEGVAVRVFDTRARVKVMAPAQEVAHHIGPTVGVIEPGDDTFCVVTIGGDPDWIARYLISLELRFEVIEPREVNDELRALAERMLSQLAEHPLADQDANAAETNSL